MHTIEEVGGTDFEYRTHERIVSRDEVMPHITPDERVGVVMDSGTDGIGAGNFVLSCVTAFYDHLKETKEDFFEYPDYYTFQSTTDPADYGMLDIYPDHKHVIVDPDPESVLRAINDRAITILLVPDDPPRSPDVDDVTLESARRRISHCYVYAPDGTLHESDFAIRLPRQPTEEWYETTAHSVETLPETYTLPSFGPNDGSITQDFRRLSLEGALSRLPAEG